MTDTPPTQFCPTCGAVVHVNARYPRYACRDCIETATTLGGLPVEIIQSHEFASGAGLRLRETGETLPDEAGSLASGTPNCLVRGRPARASEAHMGGIVVEVLS